MLILSRLEHDGSKNPDVFTFIRSAASVIGAADQAGMIQIGVWLSLSHI